MQSAFAQKPTLAHRNRLKEVEGVIERCTKAIDALVNDPASAVGGYPRTPELQPRAS